MISKAIICFIFMAPFSASAVAAEPSYLEAAVCDWHVYTHIVSEGNHAYPSLAPPDADERTQEFLAGIAVGGALWAGSLWMFGPYKTILWTLGLAGASVFGATQFNIPAQIFDEREKYQTVAEKKCRIIRRDVTSEQAKNALDFVETVKANPQYNVFYSTCIHFAEGVFHSAGQEIDILKEAEQIRSFDFGELASGWMKLTRVYRDALK